MAARLGLTGRTGEADPEQWGCCPQLRLMQITGQRDKLLTVRDLRT